MMSHDEDFIGRFSENFSRHYPNVRKTSFEQENPFSESHFIFDQIKRLKQKGNFWHFFFILEKHNERKDPEMNL